MAQYETGTAQKISRAATYLILSLLLLVVAGTSTARSAELQAGRQSVGLVLSGGGAKGIAHIGVIKALEENNIPIDYIAGTSMGAIIGGMYAAGYTTDEMLAMIMSKEFSYWSTGEIDPSYVYYYAKAAPTPKMVDLNLSLRDSSSVMGILPTSLISPLPMNFAFMELFSKYSAQCGGDFNNLFVPFRCVASDVYAKHKVVMRSGSLGDAIRASMSFPMVFAPIEIDSVLMYDGGIYDNFPVDVMRSDFAPDIMIGVDVSAPDTKPDKNNMFQQLEDMIIQNNDYSLDPDEGIKIRVPVQQFGLLDFPLARQIYTIGYDKAMEMMDSITTRITARVPAETRSLRRAVFKSQTPYVRFDSVSVTGGTPKQNAFIHSTFTRHDADTFGIARAKDSYYRLISQGKLRNLVPTAVYNDSTSLFALNLDADVKNNFNVGLGGYITSTSNSMLFLSTGYSTMNFESLNLGVNAWIGQSYMAGTVGARISALNNVPSYLELQGVISRSKQNDKERIFYDEGSTLVTDIEAFLRLNFGVAMGRNGKLTVSGGAGRVSHRFYDAMEVMPVDRDRLTLHLAQAKVFFERNNLNDQSTPTTGMSLRVGAMAVRGDGTYYPENKRDLSVDYDVRQWVQAEFDFARYWALTKHFYFGVNTTTIASTQKAFDTYAATEVMLPAFRPTASSYGYFSTAYRARQFTTLGIVPVWNPAGRFQLRTQLYCFMPWREVTPKVRVNDVDNTTSVGVAYGKLFRNPRFIGEISANYSLPFAQLTAYANYNDSPGRKWNFGLSFGLFFLAPQFLR
jgi:NTE family protein